MDKLAYHYNKKKLPGKTPGTFLYYYPCKRREQANARLEDKSYIVLEVSPRQWEMLIELDRLEYNSNHAYSRHTVRMPDSDEDAMPHTMREGCIDKGIPFSYFIHDNLDKDRLYSVLSEREQTVLRLCEEEDCTQTEAARELRVTQGYISRLLKQAREKRFYLKNKNASRDEIVWNYWHYFSSYGETPDYTDVFVEFILRFMAGDFLPLLHWFSSFGELCRFVLKCYLFDEDKIEAEITDYLHSATAQEKEHYKEYYGELPPLIGAIYIRIQKEITHRKNRGLHDSDKMTDSIVSTAEKIASRLNMSAFDFFAQRAYPVLAAWRNKRIRQFYRFYSGKSLPEKNL